MFAATPTEEKQSEARKTAIAKPQKASGHVFRATVSHNETASTSIPVSGFCQ
jgi:hypothetical protein